MRNYIRLLLIGAGLLACAAGSVRANIWPNPFDNWSGSDGTAVSNYTDTNGLNPRSYAIWTASSNWINLAPGWLTQGDIEGGNKTANFNNVADAKTGRARFGSALPTSMDALGGAAVAWRMRVGPSNPGRGPIQICLTDDGTIKGADNTVTTSAFFLVKNNGGTGGTVIDILRNGGGSYSAVTPGNIVPLTLSSNLSNEWHQWTASVIWEPVNKRGYWKLWLDGTQQLFAGAAGSPMYDPDGAGPEPSQQFSFYSSVTKDGFDGTVHNEPYVGLGDLAAQDVWDFEFDYVNYKDDGIAYFVPEPGTLLICLAGVGLVARRRSRV